MKEFGSIEEVMKHITEDILKIMLNDMQENGEITEEEKKKKFKEMMDDCKSRLGK
jgi:hypothetical protein